MAFTPPPTDDMIRRAAELRAGGATWEAAATAVGRSPITVRKWPTSYPYRWAEAFTAAQGQLVGDARTESVVTLRHQLRSESDAVRVKAADLLLRHSARKGAGRRKPADRRPKISPQLLALAAELEGLTDADIDRLLAELDELVEGEAGTAPAAEGRPAGGG